MSKFDKVEPRIAGIAFDGVAIDKTVGAVGEIGAAVDANPADDIESRVAGCAVVAGASAVAAVGRAGRTLRVGVHKISDLAAAAGIDRIAHTAVVGALLADSRRVDNVSRGAVAASAVIFTTQAVGDAGTA